MSRAGNFDVSVDFSEVERNLQAAVSRVQRGTKKATVAACEEILDESLQQVPKSTGTLAASAYYEVTGSYRNFEAEIGYGGNGDPINPETGQHASEYMVQVHEDLTAPHPHGGKAKFLEDPIKQYQQRMLGDFAAAIVAELGGDSNG